MKWLRRLVAWLFEPAKPVRRDPTHLPPPLKPTDPRPTDWRPRDPYHDWSE